MEFLSASAFLAFLTTGFCRMPTTTTSFAVNAVASETVSTLDVLANLNVGWTF